MCRWLGCPGDPVALEGWVGISDGPALQTDDGAMDVVPLTVAAC